MWTLLRNIFLIVFNKTTEFDISRKRCPEPLFPLRWHGVLCSFLLMFCFVFFFVFFFCNFPERRELARKFWYFRENGPTATKALLRSSHCILSRSCGVLVSDWLRSHGATTACTSLSWRLHCVHCTFTALTLRWRRVEDVRLHYIQSEVCTHLHQLYVCSRTVETMPAKRSSITKTCLYNFDPLKPHFYIVKLGFTGVYINFLISAQK